VRSTYVGESNPSLWDPSPLTSSTRPRANARLAAFGTAGATGLASTGGCILCPIAIRGEEAVVEAVEAGVLVLVWADAEASDATSETSLSASLSVPVQSRRRYSRRGRAGV
jgi:hypothetical protein